MSERVLCVAETKSCARCEQEKPLTQFRLRKVRSGRRYPHPYCNDCNAQVSSLWAKKNPEKRREQWRRSQRSEEGKRRAKINQRKYYFGITEAQYQQMLVEQNGMCAICQDQKVETLCVDHDHVTERIRGLLCKHCNSAIGLLKDDLELLARASTYLRRFAQ